MTVVTSDPTASTNTPGELDFAWPAIGSSQFAAVRDALAAGDVSLPFGATARLEQEVRAHLSVAHVVAHGSGTAAMLSALHAAGVESGDEVVCPAYTWWASIAPVLWLGGVPVFCDIEPDNLTVDPEDLARRVTDRTRAIVVPHLWGAAAQIREIVAWARPRGIRVIEDASHVFGTTTGHAFLGTIGDLGVFSMQAQKALPAGEGGLLVTADTDLHQRSLAVGHYERLGPDHDYAGTGLGLKLRISPLNAALAASYLPTLEAKLAHQDRLTRALIAPLLAQGRMRAVGMQDGVRHGGRTAVKLIMPVGTDVAVAGEVLSAIGLPSKPDYFHPLHHARLFRGRPGVPTELPVTDAIAPRLLHVSVPISGDPSTATALGEAAARTLAQE